MKIQTWLDEATTELKQAGIDSARLDCQILLENELQKSRDWFLAHNDEVLEAGAVTELNKKLSQRISRVPIAYIIGSKEFYGRKFLVNKDVLIPRPESEIIIELLQEVASSTDTNTIIDIGTGTGCLAITAKLLYPDIHVTAIDNSPAALVAARKNARFYQANIRFLNSDLLKNAPVMPKTRTYIVLANLPYVPAGMVTSQEINQEPAEALFSGKDGLDHYRRLWLQISELINKPGFVITESLIDQHIPMTKPARASGFRLKSSKELVQLWQKITDEELRQA